MNARSNNRAPWLVLFVALAVSVSSMFTRHVSADPIAVVDVKHEGPVEFEKEILPLLTKNCMACHNTKKAEGSLVLETPQSILKGGDSGPAVVAKQSGDSLLLKVAAHQDEPNMPPADNSVGAVAMTGEQLGLIKRWIDEGAAGTVTGQAAPLKWQPLPTGMQPVYAVAISPDGQLAVCSRANQIFVYNVASGQLVTRLSDPELIASGMYQGQGVAHLDLVQSLAFSPDGSLLASGGFREIKLWRRPQNVRKADLAGTGGDVRSLAVSADGKWAATGEASGAIKLWDLAAMKEARTFGGHTAAVTGLRFVGDGARLASGSLDKTLRLWNVADGAAAGQVETPTEINAIEILPGNAVATAGADNLVRLWTIPAEAGGAPVAGAQLAGHTGPVMALALVAGEKPQLVSGSADGSLRVWNLADNQLLREIKHGAPITAVAARGDGKQLASAAADNHVKLWNAADGSAWAAPDKQAIAPLVGDFRAQFRVAQADRAVAAMTAKVADDKQGLVDAEAKIVATAASVTATQTAKDAAAKAKAEKAAAVKAPTDAKAAADKELADAAEAAKKASEAAAQAKAAAEKDAGNADLAKASEAAKKAAEEADKKTKELEKKVADAAAALTKAQQESTTADAGSVAADQAAAAAIVAVKKAVSDVPLSEQQLKTSEGHLAGLQAQLAETKKLAADAEKPIRALHYSADGTQLASAGDNGLVRTWAADTGAPIDNYDVAGKPVTGVSFIGDSVISVPAGSTPILWHTTPGWTLERRIGNVDDAATLVDRVTALAFSPDGKLLASGGGEPSRSGELKIWNAADGALVRDFKDAHSDTVFGVAFSPDGVYLASSAADRFVKVFTAASGAPARSFEGHTHHVLGVSWKWDGKVLASCGADNVIKIWDFITGDQRRTTAPFGKEVTSIGFVGATQKVFTTSGDKTVRLVNTDNGAMEKTYAGANDFMYASDTSADGRLAVAGGQDSTLLVWLVDSGQLLRTFARPSDASAPTPQTAGK